MRKSIKNFVIGAVMAATALTASTAAFAGQFVQTDMNFRSGASKTTTCIGSVPKGAEVEVLGSANGWDLVRYNGQTGYIHGGNLGSSKPAQAQPQQVAQSTKDYFDNNWTNTAANMNANADVNTWKTVSVASGYLALRNDATYEQSNEIGQLNNGDRVEIEGTKCAGSYVYVYSPKYDRCGWVNAGFLI